MKAPLTICIMADFGNGPYAWLRRHDTKPPAVGACIADSVCGFPKDYGVSKELEQKFTEWVTRFEREYDHEGFDWETWNQQGIELSKQLKSEVGDRFLVEYHFPYEDIRFLEPPYGLIENNNLSPLKTGA